jgi:hypothetical protein
VLVLVIPALVDIESSAGGEGGERGFGTREPMLLSSALLANGVRGREYEDVSYILLLLLVAVSVSVA